MTETGEVYVPGVFVRIHRDVDPYGSLPDLLRARLDRIFALLGFVGLADIQGLDDGLEALDVGITVHE
jgi:hypothetical protein